MVITPLVDWFGMIQETETDLLSYIDQFNRAKRFKAASTRRAYNSVLRLFAQYAEAEPWPPSVDLVMDWLETVSLSNSEATVHNYWRHLRSFLNYCEGVGLLSVDENPVRRMKLAGMFPRMPDLSPTAFTDQEIALLLRHLANRAKSLFKKDERVKRDYAIIYFAYVTGARANEIVCLKLTDVDIPGRQALIRRETSKSKRDRFVGFDDEVAAALLAWLQIRPRSGSPELFVSYGGRVGIGKPLGRDALNQMLRRHCRDCGLPHRKFHALRHSSALAAMDQNIPIHKVKDQLGHRSIKMTEVYLQLRNQEQVAAYQAGGLGQRLDEAQRALTSENQ